MTRIAIVESNVVQNKIEFIIACTKLTVERGCTLICADVSISEPISSVQHAGRQMQARQSPWGVSWKCDEFGGNTIIRYITLSCGTISR